MRISIFWPFYFDICDSFRSQKIWTFPLDTLTFYSFGHVGGPKSYLSSMFFVRGQVITKILLQCVNKFYFLIIFGQTNKRCASCGQKLLAGSRVHTCLFHVVYVGERSFTLYHDTPLQWEMLIIDDMIHEAVGLAVHTLLDECIIDNIFFLFESLWF